MGNQSLHVLEYCSVLSFLSAPTTRKEGFAKDRFFSALVKYLAKKKKLFKVNGLTQGMLVVLETLQEMNRWWTITPTLLHMMHLSGILIPWCMGWSMIRILSSAAVQNLFNSQWDLAEKYFFVPNPPHHWLPSSSGDIYRPSSFLKSWVSPKTWSQWEVTFLTLKQLLTVPYPFLASSRLPFQRKSGWTRLMRFTTDIGMLNRDVK